MEPETTSSPRPTTTQITPIRHNLARVPFHLISWEQLDIYLGVSEVHEQHWCSFTCTEFGSSEVRDIQKTFTVAAADGSPHPTAATTTASTEATFPVRPTGTVYVDAASLQRRSARRLIGSGAIAAVALLFA